MTKIPDHRGFHWTRIVKASLLSLLSTKRGSAAVLLCATLCFLASIDFIGLILLGCPSSSPADAEPIDAVFTWVNGSDPEHRRLIQEYRLHEDTTVVAKPDFQNPLICWWPGLIVYVSASNS
mmetsp:Transcript_23130/g.54840  ORF Transcript_23130/g.54840 Transcript_23130/m.54840 type:complete len:122 (-) Transcript_23130:1602-1967(-)